MSWLSGGAPHLAEVALWAFLSRDDSSVNHSAVFSSDRVCYNGNKKKKIDLCCWHQGSSLPCSKQGDDNFPSPNGDQWNVKAGSCPFPSDVMVSPWKGNKLLRCSVWQPLNTSLGVKTVCSASPGRSLQQLGCWTASCKASSPGTQHLLLRGSFSFK